METYLDVYRKTQKTYDDLTQQHANSVIQTEQITQQFNKVFELMQHMPNEEMMSIKATFQKTHDTWKESTLNLETLLASTKIQLEYTRSILREQYALEI